MARPKKFDRDAALSCAIGIFAQQGYGGTSTDDLLAAMNIGRQSFYDTFGSKRALYLEALQQYNRHNTSQIVCDLQSGNSPLDGISRALSGFIKRCQHEPDPACLGTAAICEFGRRDADITQAAKTSGTLLRRSFVHALKQAKQEKEVREELDVAIAADFLLSTLSGLKISARAGMPAKRLKEITALALHTLK